MDNYSTPVLITIWNRTEYLVKLFDVLKLIKPPQLFIFSDFSAIHDEYNLFLIEKSRKLVKDSITWEADVKYKFNNYNEGPALGIFNAISWAFEYTDKLIILEHDYIPALPFFSYCEELLKKYEADERIWLISGLNHFSGKYNLNNYDSYFFSNFASIAGFATWKRVWTDIDLYMQNWETFKSNNYSFSQMNQKLAEALFNKYDNYYFNNILKDKITTWDLQFTFAFLANSGFGIVPSSNLIKMIGDDGFNTRKASIFHFLDIDETYKIKIHPKFTQTNKIYDYYYYLKVLKKRNIFQRIINRIRKFVNTMFQYV